ncbi:MAG: AAA family ATPase [Myxococcota bacterium]|nr:AAA family ATPase [Myxococcota bacterium]
MKPVLQKLQELVAARFPLIGLLTHEETRVERGLDRLCKESDLVLYRWRSTTGLGRIHEDPIRDTEDPRQALDAIRSITKPALFVFQDIHPHIQSPEVWRSMRDQIGELGKRSQAIVLVGARLDVPSEIEKDVMILDVPLPGRDEVGRLLDVLARSQKLTIEPELRQQFIRTSLGLCEREIKRAYAHILAVGGRFEEKDLSLLGEVKKQAIRKTRFLEFHQEVPPIEQVGGLSNLKEWLSRRSNAFTEEAREFGLPEPKGLFLLGVQGCGKSMMAKAVAGLFGIPLLRLDASEVFQASARQEESIQEAIRIAESISPAVLWIDELEKAFLAGDQGGSRTLGHLLTWMQEKTKPVFVVATANEVRKLPPELLRKGRFDEIFFVDLPDVHERLEILQIHLARRERSSENFDLLQCAEETEKYSGAELEQVVIEALFDAYADGARALKDRDLLRVIRETVPLAITMDDQLKELREWAQPRTRPATLDRRRIDFFEDFVGS